jgi:hypothetical protein
VKFVGFGVQFGACESSAIGILGHSKYVHIIIFKRAFVKNFWENHTVVDKV